MESAARQAGDNAFGGLFGAHVNLGTYDTWGTYMLEAGTLGAALARFSTVMRYVASHSRMTLFVTGEQVDLSYCWAARDLMGYQQICLATAGSFINTIRHYAGPSFLPDEIHLDIAKPAQATLIEDHLPLPIHFDAKQISLRFPRHLLSAKRRTVQSLSPITLSDVKRRVLTGPPESIEAAVEQLVRVQVLSGGPSFDETALALNMNVRTLRRILDKTGEGFRDLSKRIRMEIAEEMLRETDMPVRAVSETVGYSDPHNFSRAFNKQLGMRPTDMRAL